MTQDARQVLIELLFLSLYMDNHLSLAEDEVLNEALESLGWEAAGSREKFILRAYSSVREAMTGFEKTQAFIDARTAIIIRESSEAEAFTWLSKVLGADGLTPTETYFLGELQTRLFPET